MPRPGAVGAEPTGVLREVTTGGTSQYALGNLPSDCNAAEAIQLWRTRRVADEGYRTMQSRLGLDQFEGRSWRGFHHHACLVMLGYGFLINEGFSSARQPVP